MSKIYTVDAQKRIVLPESTPGERVQVEYSGGGHWRVKRAGASKVEGRRSKVNKCKGCGYPISPECSYCGECCCEEDGL